METKNRIKNFLELFIKEGRPFTVLKYRSWFILDPSEKVIVYEVVYLTKGGILSSRMINKDEIKTFKSNFRLFQKVCDDGINVAFEYKNFKQFAHKQIKKNGNELIKRIPV